MNCIASMIDPLRQWFNLNLGQPAPTSLSLSVSRHELRVMRVAFVCNPTRLPVLNLWLKQPGGRSFRSRRSELKLQHAN
jgi:hypothetical protein